MFIIFQLQPLLLQCLHVWCCLCSSPKQKCPQLLYHIPDLVPGLQSQSIRPPPVPCQDNPMGSKVTLEAGFPQIFIRNSLKLSLKFPKFLNIPYLLYKSVYYFHLPLT